MSSPNPSADPSAAPTPPTLYDALGQEPGVTEAVDRFYRRVLADPTLARFFEHTDVDRLRAHQVALFSKLLGGPDRYRGRALAAAHRGMGITDAHFDRVTEHLTAVLTELGADNDALATVGAVLEAARADIVEQPGT